MSSLYTPTIFNIYRVHELDLLSVGYGKDAIWGQIDEYTQLIVRAVFILKLYTVLSKKHTSLTRQHAAIKWMRMI